MIRRLLVFAALLAAGFLFLHFAVGDQDYAGEQTAVRQQGPAPPPPDPVRGGVQIGDGERELTVTLGGEMNFVGTRPVKRGDFVDHQTIYRLECLDSEQVQDHLLRMDEVLVKLFEQGDHVADLTAIQALVEIGRDDEGKPSIRQEKDMDLSQVVLRTRPEARSAPLRIETDRARGRITEKAVEMRTPTEQDPVLMLVEGEGGGRLTGRGLRARLPRETEADPSPIDIEIYRSPAVSAADGSFELNADGRLQYLESRLDGSFSCTISDSVRLVVAGERVAEAALGDAEGGSAVQIVGDHLATWGIRIGGSGESARSAAGEPILRFVRLRGAPASLTAPGLRVRASTFALLPGGGRDPLLVTASGSGVVMDLTDAQTGEQATFTAGRRIHVVRPAARLQPVYRSFGFPDWSTRMLARRDFIRFEGPTSVRTASGLALDADEGLLLLRPGDGTGPLLMRGYGLVEIRQRDGAEELAASGNLGFTLLRAENGETLVLGPMEPDPSHSYSIERGELSLRGTGSCRFERVGDGEIRVDLDSDAPTISGVFGEEVELQGAEHLDATLRGDVLAAFEATGPELVAGLRREGEAFEGRVFTGRGRRIVQEEPDVFRLEGTAEDPAVVQRRAGDSEGELAEWTAPILRMYRLGAAQVLLDAEVGPGRRAQLHIRQPGRDATPPMQLDLGADHMRLIPYALPPLVVRLHRAWRPAGDADPFAGWLQQPILLARGKVVVETSDPDSGAAVEARGDRFVLATSTRSGFLQGSSTEQPAIVIRRERDGRELRAEAPAIRVARAGQGERLLLMTKLPSGEGLAMPPRLHLFDPEPKVDWGGEGPMRLMGTSTGEIRVMPRLVDFEGPVHVVGLLADGTPDPNGPDVQGRKLWMTRDQETGAVTRIDARGEVSLDWHRVRGRSSSLGLDLSETLCTVVDPDGAEVWMPGIGWMRALRIEADYTSLGVSLWNGTLRRAEPDRNEARMR